MCHLFHSGWGAPCPCPRTRVPPLWSDSQRRTEDDRPWRTNAWRCPGSRPVTVNEQPHQNEETEAAPATEATARSQFLRSTRDGVLRLCNTLVGIFAFITVFNWFEFPEGVREPLIASDVLCLLAFGGMAAWLRKDRGPRSVVVVTFAVVALLLQNILLAHTLRPSLVYFGYIVIIALATGAIAVSRKVALGFLGLVWIPTVPVLIATTPSADWTHILTALFAASVVMLLIQRHNERLLVEGRQRLAAELALRTANDQLEILSQRDPLTGLGNRRFLTSRLEALCNSPSTRLSLALIDLDQFKPINDNLGHLDGDRFLRRVAGALREATRGGDSVGRWGGDEFIVILPDTGLDAAQHAAARLVERVRAVGGEHGLGGHLVTASVGVAERQPGESADALVHRADMAAYAAKAEGGDQFSVGAGAPLH